MGLLCCPGAEVAVVDEPPTGSSWPKASTGGIIKDSASRQNNSEIDGEAYN